jgi:hypothetical protein
MKATLIIRSARERFFTTVRSLACAATLSILLCDGDRAALGQEAEPADPKAKPAAAAEDDKGWTSLFDGKALGKWKSTEFGGEGEVAVKDGTIQMPFGNDMTGITWAGKEPPATMNYEITLEAMRVDGTDFFCGLTFPVGKNCCSLICGGWGGGVTGLSSIDGFDASENDTSQWIEYKNKKWYRIRVRVTDKKIEAWLDKQKIVDVETKNRKIDTRIEVDPSKPLGIACWQTHAALRDIRIRKLPAPK